MRQLLSGLGQNSAPQRANSVDSEETLQKHSKTLQFATELHPFIGNETDMQRLVRKVEPVGLLHKGS